METQLIEIREQQKATWNKFSGGWKKWDDFTMNFLKPMGDGIISELNLQKDDNVLDIACGTGEPGLTIARLVTRGKVTGTDLSDQMLEIAKENAVGKNIHNYETRVCDVCELPFAEDTFNKVSCRMGFMFFPDMQLAADEMYRVLKSGGKMATSVWAGPAENTWITTVMSVINKNLQVPPPPQGAPGMFRCAAPSFIRTIMEKSGFINVKEQLVSGRLLYEDFDQMWEMMNEVAAPVVGALSKADAAMKQKIRSEVQQLAEQRKTGQGIEMDYASWVISGDK